MSVVGLETMKLCFANFDERIRELKGDQLVDSPMINSTHAITIDTSAHHVWPWIAQLGQGRGGFYSYTLLENLLGCRMRNADRIHPEWQEVAVGDRVNLHPLAEPLLVDEIEVNRHLVLFQQVSFAWSWAFVLEQLDDDRTRLLVRFRISKAGWILRFLLFPVMTVGHYVMERKMLVGIKKRCET